MQDVDFDEEARKLFAALNLPPSGIGTSAAAHRRGYRPLDAVYRHPQTGAQVFIGNQEASQNIEILKKSGISCIVNCTDSMPNVFEDRPSASIEYYRFDIYKHMRGMNLRRGHEGVLEAFEPMFAWVDSKVNAGKGVLIHCLAGAHRAGTTGVAYTMHAAKLNHRTAIAACQTCRPEVHPICDLSELLRQLDIAMEQKRKREGTQAPSTAAPGGATSAEAPAGI
mmetsp:Transcript_22594/g.52658  ORF Transcript_22594/g.52658 Transcript_22594/m.52658 type:complete len:224 (-) Transcript_22594:67-738(-)